MNLLQRTRDTDLWLLGHSLEGRKLNLSWNSALQMRARMAVVAGVQFPTLVTTKGRRHVRNMVSNNVNVGNFAIYFFRLMCSSIE